MSKKPVIVLLALLLLTSTARAQPDVPGMLKIYPVGEQTCVAVGIDLVGGLTLTGLSWFHNDETVSFPSLLIVEGTHGESPILDQPGLVLAEVTGEALAWGEVTLLEAVSSSTDYAYAVFLYPANQEISDLGSGGGPGIGLLGEVGEPIFLSHEGTTWIQFDSAYRLAVEPETSAAKSGVRVLSEMRGSVLEAAASVANNEPPVPKRTRLRAPAPNPFNPRTVLRLELSKDMHVEMKLYNLAGRLVKTLVHEHLPAGFHEIVWEGRDNRGRAVSSGKYFVRAEIGKERVTKGLTLVR